MDLLGVVALAVVAALGFGLWLAMREGDTFTRIVGGLLACVAAACVLAVAAIALDFQDADGIVDCWPHCSGWQNVVKWTFWLGALLTVMLVVVIGVRVLVDRWRGR